MWPWGATGLEGYLAEQGISYFSISESPGRNPPHLVKCWQRVHLQLSLDGEGKGKGCPPQHLPSDLYPRLRGRAWESGKTSAMEMLYRLASPDIVHAVLAALAGGGSVWLVSYLLFRVRLRRAVNEACERALSSSRRVLKGQAAEQLAPLTRGFDYLPSDARFLGSPIDYVVFDGLSEESVDVEIVFVEVKTGRSRLTPREARVKEAVQAGRVRWQELRM